MEAFAEEASKSEAKSSVAVKTPGPFGVHDTLRYGFSSARRDITAAHPLQQSEAKYAATRESEVFQTLRTTQGLHAPLRLQMERKIASRIQRLPPLESSMVALETLTGNDQRLNVEDILSFPSEPVSSVDTHTVMQNRLKLN